MPPKYYYAVKDGYTPGIYNSWDRAKREVDGFSRPKYKKFKTFEEAAFYYETGQAMESGTTIKLNHRTKRLSISRGKLVVKEPTQSDQIQKTDHPIKKPNKTVEEVFTDGSAIHNGKPNCKAGYAVYFGDKDPKNIAKKLPRHPSNQHAELKAIETALDTLVNSRKKETKTIVIYTDSKYSINCVTVWINNWRKNNWKTTKGELVKHASLIRSIDQLVKTIEKEGTKVRFEHINSHTTAPSNKNSKEYRIWYGNNAVDKMAQKICMN